MFINLTFGRRIAYVSVIALKRRAFSKFCSGGWISKRSSPTTGFNSKIICFNAGYSSIKLFPRMISKFKWGATATVTEIAPSYLLHFGTSVYPWPMADKVGAQGRPWFVLNHLSSQPDPQNWSTHKTDWICRITQRLAFHVIAMHRYNTMVVTHHSLNLTRDKCIRFGSLWPIWTLITNEFRDYFHIINKPEFSNSLRVSVLFCGQFLFCDVCHIS